MAIKDSIIQNVLKSGKSNNAIRNRYQRLRLFDENSNDESETSLEKTEHKPSTNRAQTEHKPNTKQDTNRTQTEHKTQKIYLYNQETEHKPDTQPNTTLDTNRTQTEHKPNTPPLLSSIIGLQRLILFLLFHYCKLARARITQELSLQHISESLKIRLGSVKTTIKRLQEKGFIKRVSFKNGRGGWSQYELPDDIYREMIHLDMEHKPDTNWLQTGHKLVTQPDTEPYTSPSSSSSVYKKTTTTDEGEENQNLAVPLLPEWNGLDIEPLQEFGFSRIHLAQIASDNKLAAEIIQDSIYAFAFDLQNNSKAKTLKTNPLNYFMGIMRSGKPYAPPNNYESPSDQAMRVYLERKRELEQKRAAMEKALLDAAFEDWQQELSEEEKITLLPEDMRHSRIQGGKTALLRIYFAEKVWPDKRRGMAI